MDIYKFRSRYGYMVTSNFTLKSIPYNQQYKKIKTQRETISNTIFPFPTVPLYSEGFGGGSMIYLCILKNAVVLLTATEYMLGWCLWG
jgi:hypothetical protein